MIKLTIHVQARLRQWHIEVAWIKATSADPDSILRQGRQAMMRTTYDPEADAYYARFVPDAMPIAQTIEVAPGVMIDLDSAGDMVGIEVLSVRRRAGGAYGAATKVAAE